MTPEIIPVSTKEEIIQGLQEAWTEVNDAIKDLSDQSFNAHPDGKWSAAFHLQHLIVSAYPVANALKQPKLILRAFGTSKNGSRTFVEMLNVYETALQGGLKSSGKYDPKESDVTTPVEMLKNWNMILSKFVDRLNKWSEADLDKYRIPHPAIGSLTFREILFFTIFHTKIHLKRIKEYSQ